MARVIDFESSAVASLRRRAVAAENANRDLIAFARGRNDATAAVHAAVLAALDAEGAEHLVHVVTQMWPDLLRIDAAAFVLDRAAGAACCDASGLYPVSPESLMELTMAPEAAVTLRNGERGHPLFGPARDLIRSEVLVRLEPAASLRGGLLVLGQRRADPIDTLPGTELPLFLGRILVRMAVRWLPR